MAYTTINDPSAYFQITLYTGNGGTQSITNGGNSDLQPDWLWIKDRDDNYKHLVVDSVRGATKHLSSSSKATEITNTANVTGFASDGFAIASDGNVNANTEKYVAWQWKKTANAGFDIVSYTGNDSAGRTISHSLSAVPKMMIVKCRNVAKEWTVFHSSQGNGKFIELDQTTAVQTATNRWNDTSPTSSVFSLGVDSSVNASNQTYIAYLFAEKQGYSKFGSYTGNANANGTYVYTGFKPAYVLTKQTNSSDEPWIIKDLKRSPLNTGVDSPTLFASVNTAESNRDGMDFFSNGFKCRDNGAPINSGSYLYMAFAESPFVTSTGVPTTAQ
jgi:hypothetical protein|tara:strand:+ start:920 stop:1909 length:990 start_codon:yes stop_codon:yes gene_type:complete